MRKLWMFHSIVATIILLSFLFLLIQLEVINSCLPSVNVIKQKVECDINQIAALHFLSKSQPRCFFGVKGLSADIDNSELPSIYVITPTYSRPVQKAELTRLSYAFCLVPNIRWIVVEDSSAKSQLVSNFLEQSGLYYVHLNVPTPPRFKLKSNDPNWLKPRGVLQRNLALQWLQDNLKADKDRGVIYFADDDNTYDIQLFEEMRYTKKVSVWPVGLAGGLMVERPHIKNGRVVGWKTIWKQDRPFATDMAGFAVNLRLFLQNPKARFSLQVPRGYQESHFLKYIVTMDELEPKANNCTKVLVWHTRTEHPVLKYEVKLRIPSNLNIEV